MGGRSKINTFLLFDLGQDYWLQLSVSLSSLMGVLVGRSQMFLYFTGDRRPDSILHTTPLTSDWTNCF